MFHWGLCIREKKKKDNGVFAINHQTDKNQHNLAAETKAVWADHELREKRGSSGSQPWPSNNSLLWLSSGAVLFYLG